MTSFTSVEPTRRGRLFIGVDTHKEVHVAVAVDGSGHRLGDLHFPTTRAGFAVLDAWAARFGQVDVWGVEGTASYGAGLTRYLLAQGARVREVNRPDRSLRRSMGGKTDPIDAEAAALAVLSGRARVQPKTGDGHVEMLRHVRMARCSAVKAQTVAMNQLKAILVTAPPQLRERLEHLANGKLIEACTRLRPASEELTIDNIITSELRTLASRWRTLQTEAAAQHKLLAALVSVQAPRLLAQFGVGPDTAAALLIAAGDNPHRLHSEAAFAALCGTNPIPASSGKTNRHRLNRGGDRQANAALHRIVVVRLCYHEETRDYMAARRTPNKSNTMHLMRCLKRHLARRIYPLLLDAVHPTKPTAQAP